LLVHRGWANDSVTALSVARTVAGRYVYPIHRLDRSASGVLVFGLRSEIARVAQAQLQAGQWQKEYVALVRGHTPESGRIDYPLAPAKDKPKRDAVTDYQRIGTFERYSLLRVWPHTGRLHQIRRHLRHLSHPLIGDVRYGKAEHNRLFRQRFGLHRLCLHAVRLELPHPSDGRALTLEAPLPADLAEPLARMGLLPPSATSP
jgi:tRNA pseudouridine65 synthase